MLIGGPNQSHKVNFKEPVPLKGKIANRSFRFSFVNTFSRISKKSFVKERLNFLSPFISPPCLKQRAQRKECGTCKVLFLIQDISVKSIYRIHNYLITNLLVCIYFFINLNTPTKHTSKQLPIFSRSFIVSILWIPICSPMHALPHSPCDYSADS